MLARVGLALCIGLCACALAAPAVAAPPEPAAASPAATEGLLADVERVVRSEENSGWLWDKAAFDEVHETLLESVCRAPEQAREAALGVLRRRADQLGDPETLYKQARNELTAEVDDALFAQRKLQALERAVANAAADCPFFVEPDPDFRGLQTDRKRLLLSLETGGVAQLRRTENSWTFGGGGNARLLVGYGFGGVSLLLGPEFGGGAMLKPNTEPTEFVINYFPALPVIFRINDVEWHYDFEAAPVALFQADNGDLSYGVRGGFGLGIYGLKVRGVIPWAGAAVAYEHYFPSGGRDRAHFVRGGLRVGVVWDP